jgi:small conductance mechanosensitive channel
VDRFGDFGFHIKCILKTSPGEQYRVRREVLRRIKNRFDELGIEIPAARAAAISGQ